PEPPIRRWQPPRQQTVQTHPVQEVVHQRQCPQPMADQLERAILRRVHAHLHGSTVLPYTVRKDRRWRPQHAEGEDVPDEIARLDSRYRELKKQLQGLGFAVAGTVTERYTMCGKASCRCHADPPQRHGPYYQYSRKVAGKTTSRLITAQQAER